MHEVEQAAYRGKHFDIPQLSREGYHIAGNRTNATPTTDAGNPILADLNTIWDLRRFLQPRIPISISTLTDAERKQVGAALMPRVLDMPIKFPGTEYRLPRELEPIKDIVQRVADFEELINHDWLDSYYCYLTVDRGIIRPGETLREAPCHVDGFQGARWNPKVLLNHTYSVSDVVPTSYYIQPFDFSQLDEKKHDFFWEMNRQVAMTNSLFAWRPENGAIALMDAYTVHRGTESDREQPRVFIRLSYEARIFDRLGNAHNPMFDYNWPMVPRDIEALKLEPFDPTCDPSLRVFPHQNLDGTPITAPPAVAGGKRPKTQPTLRTASASTEHHLTWIPPESLLGRVGWVHEGELRKLVREKVA